MKTQQAQLEQRLEQLGWQVVDRETGLYGWAAEIWTIESNWHPVGRRLWITFVMDPWPGSRPDFVSTVGVTAWAPSESNRVRSAVNIRHGWTAALEDLLAQIARLRVPGDPGSPP